MPRYTKSRPLVAPLAPISGAVWFPLPDGQFFLVSEEDKEAVSEWNWCLNSDGYVQRGESIGNGRTRTLRLHRDLMKARPDQIVDHINRDKLDNRRENLRFVTKTQNNVNSDKLQTRQTSSKFKGVYWESNTGKWKAQIGVSVDGKKKRLNLGRFNSEAEAAKVYNEAAVKHFGEYAKLNMEKSDV